MSDDTFHGLALGLIVGIVATIVLMLFFTQRYHKSEMVAGNMTISLANLK